MSLILWAVLACGQSAGENPSTAHLRNKPIILGDGQTYQGEPAFFRIIKRSDDLQNFGRLEAFIQGVDGAFKFYKSWDVCNYSGDLGPKLTEGDGQSPEGFYFVKRSSLNPNSSYHLSFNLGFPNAYDRAHGRTGSFLMVHGDCVSIGCYAMSNEGIEEIYTLLEQALDGGQDFVRVHIFPFEMTDENMTRYAENDNFEFWSNLKEGWDWFEVHGQPPNVTVENKHYSFNFDTL